MITVRSTINLAHQSVPNIIPVVQGDTGRSILFTLADFTIPEGAVARYFVMKPSGLAVYNDATIDGNTVLVELTAQSIIETGDNYGQVRISVGEDIVTSFDFIMHVDPFRGIDAAQSEAEINIFDRMLEQAQETVDTMVETAEQAIEDAAEAAEQYIAQAIDPTLTESNKAADAKVVGDALSEINETLEDVVADVDTKAPAIYCTTSGSLVTIPDGADSMPIKSMTVDVEAVQAGTGDPSPQNIRSISGWTGCKLYRTGKNLLDASDLIQGGIGGNGSVTTSSTRVRSNYVPIKGNTIITASVRSGYKVLALHYYKSDSEAGWISRTTGSAATLTVTTEDATQFVRIVYGKDDTSADVTPTEVTSANPQLEYGSTTTEYEAYKGETYDITFPSEAGTVYGAKIDPVNGTMEVNKAIATLDENTSFSSVSGNTHSFYAENVFPSGITALTNAITPRFLCNQYTEAGYISNSSIAASMASGTWCNQGSYRRRVWIRNENYSTPEDFAASLANNNIQIVYPLDTPVTFTLNPVTIRTLLGLNNIWADTGAIEELTYAADTKLYIEELTKPSEDDLIANSAIEAGKFFMIGNRLFLSTASIANGAAITPGTNATELSLAEALNTLNS